MATIAVARPLPEDIEIAVLRLAIAIGDERSAREHADLVFRELRNVFVDAQPIVTLLYDLDFELVEVTRGSWKFVSKATLRLKLGWKTVKKSVPPAYLVVVTALGGLTQYEDLRKGAVLAYKDLEYAFEIVIKRHQDAHPGVIEGGRCQYVAPADPPQPNDEA